MILIVEGANRTGKSTLIAALEKLAEKKNIMFSVYNERINKNEHSGTTPDGMYAYAKSTISNLMNTDSDDKLIVFDRFHVSEYVYGEAFRGYINESMLKINEFLHLIDAKIVYMRSDFKHVEDKHKALEYEALQNRFDKAFVEYFKCKNVKAATFDGASECEREEVAEEVMKWLLS